ncbi:flagellar basal body L-ring protein FlgH [Parachitinimonas caeni]|uniref:Flagellar L-ring protein n=1 Tax=Parachitinimonas caeni TaxID=3031301 RepID=A0ABT7DUI4_9NEIS|nr:flagellar basal body L-ring protein FlgH [Parachitinimonas caeni]MDK2123737.1 flagellar basal body L-ring protein FlgH [Parachitinimonas caeni]
MTIHCTLPCSLRLLLTAGASLLLVACADIPKTIINQPTSVRPAPAAQANYANGSIFQANSARLLFEDRLARAVGDSITIQIEEQISATSKSGNKGERTGSVSSALSASASSSTFTKALGGTDIGLKSSNNFDGKGETTSSNSFSGTITASVVEILANGNLVLAGEKQININGEVNHLRVSGVVNPADVKAGNVVSSTKIAEARIEQVGVGAVADASRAGWLQKFFLSLMPF